MYERSPFVFLDGAIDLGFAFVGANYCGEEIGVMNKLGADHITSSFGRLRTFEVG
jgi:hypothetical protein